MKLRDHPSVTKFDAFRVDPRALKVTPGYNVRDFSTTAAQEALTVLKEEIREEGGVLDPLEVRMIGDELHIVSGHRRHRAVMELIAEGVAIESVPAIAEQRAVNDAERVLRLILHNSGEPLTMLEKAEVVRRLLNMGWDREKIANRLGYKTKTAVANFELLLSAPEIVKQAVRDDQISPSTAIELVRQHGEDAGEKLPDIRTTATKRGKSRASIRDVRPPGNASPMDIERRNQRRLDDFNKSQESEKAHDDLARLEKVLAILIDFDRNGISAKVLAAAYGTRRGSELEPAAGWLYEFIDALRAKEKERAA